MITVEFKDFDEMLRFAKELLGRTTAPAQEPVIPTAQPDVPAASAAPKQPVQAVPTAFGVPAAPVAPAAPATPAAPAGPMTAITPPAPTAPAMPAVPTTAKSYTVDDLARAATTLMDAGRQGELIGLLQQFGVATLPALPREQYGAFATALRGLGAQI